MGYLLFFVILFGFCLLIPRIPFLIKSGLAPKYLVAFFLVRAAMGVINCYLSYHYFTVSDSLTFHNVGLNEYYLLTTDPAYFFSETFTNYHNHYSGLLETSQSFWNNLKTNVIVKTLAILDVLTRRNFYVNTLIFNIPVFFGTVALFRALKTYFQKYHSILAISVFLFPSALFYTSSIHRDGLVWMSLGLIIYVLNQFFSKGYSWKRLLLFLFSFLLIFSLRNYVAFIIVPALAAWWLSWKKEKYSAAIFTMILMLCILLFFSLRNFIPLADFPQYVANRQADFNEIAEVSRTYLPMNPLTPDFYSFLKSFPLAFKHAFLLPFIGNMQSTMELPFALEILLIEILFCIWLFQRKKSSAPMIYFILFICIINMVMIGYTVPNLGAIIRYRSIYLNLIFICLAGSINWEKLTHKHIVK